MANIMTELEQLDALLADDPFLGKGTLTVSQIFYTSPSRWRWRTAAPFPWTAA